MSRLAFSCIAAALWSCGGSTLGVTHPTVRINSPTTGTTVLSYKPITFSVTVTDRTPIQTVTLQAGSVTIKTCPGNGATQVDCSTDFNATDVAAQINNGQLTLTAAAVDTKSTMGSQSAFVSVKPIRVTFVDPPAMGDPPVAVVKGMGTLSVDAEADVALTSIVVKDKNGTPVHTFTGDPPFEMMIPWAAYLGVGSNTLTALATDAMNETDTATLAVQVQCSGDADCNPGQKCCASSGACYASGTPNACQ